MAFTKAQLEEANNTELASDKPILASDHRSVNQKVIDQLYDAQALGNNFNSLSALSTPLANDSIFVIRDGVAYKMPASVLDFVQNFRDLSDVNIPTPVDGQVVYYNESTSKFELRSINEIAGGLIFLNTNLNLPTTGIADTAYLIGHRLQKELINNPSFIGSITGWTNITFSDTPWTYSSDRATVTLAAGASSSQLSQSVEERTVQAGSFFRVYCNWLALATAYNVTFRFNFFNNGSQVRSFSVNRSGFSSGGLLLVEELVATTFTYDEIRLRAENNAASSVTVRISKNLSTPFDAVEFYTSKEKSSEILYWNGSEFINTFDRFISDFTQVDPASSIVLDFDGKIKRTFSVDTNVSTAKTISVLNFDSAGEFDLTIPITNVAAVLTFPSSFISGDTGWDSGSFQFTPPNTGTYKISGVFNGTKWLVSFKNSSAVSAPSILIPDTDVLYYEQEDWVSGALGLGFTTSVSGAGTSGFSGGDGFGVNGTENCIGVFFSTTGTTTTGRAAISRTVGGDSMAFGYHEIKYRTRSALAALSDGTNTYTVYTGIGDNPVSGDMTDGVYFRYTHGVNSGRWEAVCASGATRTAVDTGVTANTVFSIFEIRVNQAGNSVTFYINGVLVATITTNIPGNGGQNLIHKIEKSAGTTARNFYQDWYDLLITRTTPR